MRVLLVISLLFVTSCVKQYPLNLTFGDNISKSNREWINEEFNFAYDKLSKCKNKSVKERFVSRQTSAIQSPTHSDIFSFLETRVLTAEPEVLAKYKNSACAYVYKKHHNTIYLNSEDDFRLFYDGEVCEDMSDTIGHELLHLLGFNHRTKAEFKEMNKAMNNCGFINMEMYLYENQWKNKEKK